MMISQLGELELINRIMDKRDKLLDNLESEIFASYRDDAALQVNNDIYTVLSSDMLIEHTHFPRGMTYYQMGQKIVTVNVSDILAMNATPESIIISMALPPQMDVESFDSMVDGILSKCIEYNVSLIGGDINENTEIVLSATSTGQVNRDVKLQNGICERNIIAITGNLGSPAAALDLINNPDNNLDQDKCDNIISSILEPDLPIDTARLLRRYPKIVNTMTDITDGLARELGNIKSHNSDNTGFVIYEDKIPYDPYIEVVANTYNKSLYEYLLHFGEEFELLLILDEVEYNKHMDKLSDIYIIGYVTSDNSIKIIDKNNKIHSIQQRGYEHLRKD
ncbi:MAG: thiamine-phosphate kinase [Methanosphaera sp.]|nr:thiamine-phosphate kinase [Methanosphaera sp.]